VPIEVGTESNGVAFSRLTDEAADCGLHDLLGVLGKQVCKGEDVIEVTASLRCR